MGNQLTLYNDALRACGERALASLTEERKPRRLLDAVWASDGVKYCIEQGIWGFAKRTIAIDYDPSIEPPFGYRRAFEKPSDWVSTAALCSDEDFHQPLLQYEDEAGYWYSDLDTIYVQYMSDDSAYGLNIGEWPESFMKYVVLYFASEIVLGLGKGQIKLERIIALREKALKIAKSKAKQSEPTRFPPAGSWIRSRGGRGRRRDTNGDSVG